MIILGIHDGHDAGASIIKDGKIMAAVNEERLNRIKLYVGLPHQSINKVLEMAKLTPKDIDQIALSGTSGLMTNIGWEKLTIKKKFYQNLANNTPFPSYNFFPKIQRTIFNNLRSKNTEKYLRKFGFDSNVKYFDHHKCHAATAYFASGKKECLVFTTDGSGDGLSASVYKCKDGEMNLIKEIPTFHSVGYFYAYVTMLFGFKMFKHEGKCVTGDTPILLADGTIKPIEEIYKENEKNAQIKGNEAFIYNQDIEIISIDKNLKNKKNKVDYIYRQKINEPLYKITTYSGKEVTVTANHKFFIMNDSKIEEIPAINLSNNDFLAVPKKLETYGKEIEEEWAIYSAHVLGDGCDQYHPNKSTYEVSYFNAQQHLVEEFNDSVKSLFNKIPKTKIDNKNLITSRVHLYRFIPYLESKGFVINKRSASKQIPNSIMMANNLVKAKFLRAFFDDEGDVLSQENKKGGSCVEICTTSKNIADFISYSLMNFGIHSRINITYKRATNGRKKEKTKAYVLRIWGENVLLYNQFIGFTIDYKVRNLKTIVAKVNKKHITHTNVIPCKSLVYKKALNIGVRKFMKTYGMYIRPDSNFQRSISHYKCKKIAEDFNDEKLKKLVDSDIFWDKIKKIEILPAEERFVYDLNVPIDHNYIGGFGGLILHNTTGLAAFGDPNKCYNVFEKCFTYKNGAVKNNLKLIGRPAYEYLKKNLSSYSREDIAAAVQKRLEDVMTKFIQDYINKTGIHDIALAGGVFSNVKLNQKIMELKEVNSIFIYPNMGDGGLASGSAFNLYAEEMLNKGSKLLPYRLENVYFGPEYSNEEIEKEIKLQKMKAEYVKDIEKYTAELISKKKIVGHFSGRMEYGPRALGNRSILADPTDKTINDWLNKRMKRCYDEETEILTLDGWKYFKDINKNEIVVTLNPKTNSIEYKKIQDKIKYYYTGNMIKIKNKRVDLLVTPNHKLWIKKRNKKYFEFEYAENIVGKRHTELKGGAKWIGKYKKIFILPSIKVGIKMRDTKKIEMNKWMEFLGYWVAEGSAYYDNNGHYKVSIAQSKKSKHFTTIESCLKKLPFHYLYDKKEFIIYNKQLYEYLKPLKGARNKKIPNEFLKLTKKQLGILFTSMNNGDGNIRGKQYRYSTTSRRLADQVQEIALKLGYSSYLSTQKSKNPKHADSFLVRIGRSPISYVRDEQSSIVDYKGYVYCVTVQNHIIFVRRNGKAYFSGNSEFMPFAPSIMKDYASDYFENFEKGSYPAEFMTITFNCKKKALKAEAVVHVDNTARPQVVTKESNKRYYSILNNYNKITGLPLFINTSFNIHEEPIVCSPKDALISLKQDCVDLVVAGNWVIRNKK